MRRLMRSFFQGLMSIIFSMAKKNAMYRAKTKALKAYLSAVQIVRQSVIGLLALFFTLQIIFLGLVLMGGAGIYLAPWDLRAKAFAVFGCGAFLFFIPVTIIMIALSEKTWFKASGADKMIKDLMHDNS